jgi:hypothetical protein
MVLNTQFDPFKIKLKNEKTSKQILIIFILVLVASILPIFLSVTFSKCPLNTQNCPTCCDLIEIQNDFVSQNENETQNNVKCRGTHAPDDSVFEALDIIFALLLGLVSTRALLQPEFLPKLFKINPKNLHGGNRYPDRIWAFIGIISAILLIGINCYFSYINQCSNDNNNLYFILGSTTLQLFLTFSLLRIDPLAGIIMIPFFIWNTYNIMITSESIALTNSYNDFIQNVET